MKNTPIHKCSHCKNLRQLMKHPQNKTIGKGSILESMGFVCIAPLDKESQWKAYFFEKDNGECELIENNTK